MLFLARHVPHQVVDELVHLLDILSQVSLILETHHVICHLHHQTPRAVIILGAVANLG